jgi:acetolactate synthase-1/2/3 large subunit
LLAIGARLDRVVTGFAPERFANGAEKIMVDIDPAELRKMGDSVPHLICSDAGDFIRELLAQRASLERVSRDAWKQRCAEWKRRYPVVLPEHCLPAGPVSTYNLAKVLSEELSAGDFIVSGSSGSGIELFLLAFDVKPGQRIFHTTALGSMGFGIAATIGASLAGGRKRTICVDGDGGFMFNIQELETVARLALPVTFFVLNNDGYASIRASQTNYFGAAKIGCDAATGQTLPDICRIAEAFGIATDRIVDQTDLRAQLRRVLARPGPVVCDVTMVRDEVRAPRLSSVQLPDGSFVSAPLEDLWPFLERDEFAANMLATTADV